MSNWSVAGWILLALFLLGSGLWWIAVFWIAWKSAPTRVPENHDRKHRTVLVFS